MKPLNTEAATPAVAPKTRETVFKYAPPPTEKAKTIVRLCRSDIIYAQIQVIKEGGENNMHAHNAQDGFWMVLKGRAKFYGEGDQVIADLGPYEGVHIPRDFYYWFESSSDEILEILQVESIDNRQKENLRLNATPKKDWAQQIKVI